jgi:hypothetical protein
MFKIGQKVVCKNIQGFVDSHPIGLKIGQIYTVMQIGVCACGQETLAIKEAPKIRRYCGTTGVMTGVHANFYSYRFEPLIEDWVEELLEKIKLEVDQMPQDFKNHKSL